MNETIVKGLFMAQQGRWNGEMYVHTGFVNVYHENSELKKGLIQVQIEGILYSFYKVGVLPEDKLPFDIDWENLDYSNFYFTDNPQKIEEILKLL